ncbi:MAG: GAF domain-containing sensor histidine kinase, partial [Cryobacterium sp.]|nr:GAF domain-containing sensor histidine kinase [Oligoflexia bacterium]
EKRLYFKSAHGLPEDWADIRDIPIGDPICQYTLVGKPVVIEDARDYPDLMVNPSVSALSIGSYLGIPMMTKEGQNLGSFCVIDRKVRKWTENEIATLTDLTFSAMAEIELRAVVKQLQAERELRETFVSTLTHDLRSPLSAAKLNIELIQRNPADLARLPKVLNSLNKIDKMVQNLLDANLIRAGHTLPLQLQEGNISESLVKISQTIPVPSRVKLVSMIDPDIHGVFDPNALERLTENLVSNAVKYGDTELPITLSLTRTGNAIELCVHNYGNAISELDQSTLFHPYRRAAGAISSGIKGWGLGLTLVRGVAHGHGGDVRVKSNSKDGTTFTVTLPFRAS